MSNSNIDKKTPPITEQQVIAYLRANPDFLQLHPDILTILLPPKHNLGDNVEDFQHHMLSKLQLDLQKLKNRYSNLIDASRDNMSIQSQVHKAVLGIVKTENIEQLLQMLRQDFLQLFAVDIVTLALESEIAQSQYYADKCDGSYNSGLSVIKPGAVNNATNGKSCKLIADITQLADGIISQIFPHDAGMINSVALLKLVLPSNNQHALLAFGSRKKGHFHSKQGVELLDFMARIIEYKLDKALQYEGLEGI